MRSFLTIAWLLLVLLLGPVVGVLGARRVAAQMPPRRLVYMANAANLIVLGAITAAIDVWRGAPVLALFSAPLSGAHVALWAVAMSLGALTIWLCVLFVRAHLRRPPRATVIRILPRTAREKAAFALLCLLIGTVEEYLYRGFSLTLLHEWFGSGLAAILLVSVSFALMHGIQDRIAIAGAFCQGLLLGMPVLVIGSLVPSVIAHAVVDMASGFALLPVLRAMGMPAAALESVANG